jgi:hypothetical protein
MNEQPSSVHPSEELVKRLCFKVAQNAGWIKFLGVISIIYGVFIIFTLWGILICWLPIWIGVILFKAAGDAEMAARGAPTQLEGFLEKINRYFLIQGILSLIGIIIGLVLVFLFGMAAILGLSGLG